MPRFRAYPPTILFLLALCALTPTATANEAAGAGCAEPAAHKALPADARAETAHRLPLPEGPLHYRTTAAATTLEDDAGCPKAQVFFIAYRLDADTADAARPITFVFNGGPGAASAYLHLGALGPRRLVLAADGGVPPPPATLANNAESWLPFTDLVFVDPPGTGYSRSLHAGDDGDGPPWGVDEDIRLLAQFIADHLTRSERWSSPVFLAGESYGGFRMPLLAERLARQEGVAVSGLVLISPVLDFSMILGGDDALLRWAGLLPSYAAVATHHGRGAGLALDDSDPRRALDGVEDFALDTLLSGLARGDAAPADEWRALLQRLADYTGLPLEELGRRQGRIEAGRFAKRLLADRGLILSAYDGRLTAVDPDPASARADAGLYLDRIGSAFTAALHTEMRDTLAFETELPYRTLNREVAKEWNWASGIDGPQGFASALDALRRAFSLNPEMRVLVTHGVHDLVTPYFASAISLTQMALHPSLQDQLHLAVYPGGHMFYSRGLSRRRLQADARNLYAAVLQGMRAGAAAPPISRPSSSGEASSSDPDESRRN